MKDPGLQELFLNALRRERVSATFFLVNGFQMKGLVQSFDSFTVLLRCGADQELVFKHAISTIVPSRPLCLPLATEE